MVELMVHIVQTLMVIIAFFPQLPQRVVEVEENKLKLDETEVQVVEVVDIQQGQLLMEVLHQQVREIMVVIMLDKLVHLILQVVEEELELLEIVPHLLLFLVLEE